MCQVSTAVGRERTLASDFHMCCLHRLIRRLNEIDDSGTVRLNKDRQRCSSGSRTEEEEMEREKLY